MACTGRYAQAWEYAAMWCEASILLGAHEGAGPADAALQVAGVHFLNAGVRQAVGMKLYNLTQNTQGPITAVTEHTVTATGVTWAALDRFRLVTITATQEAAIEFALDITAGDIHVALAASGACACNLASWAGQYLAKLNIIEAGVMKKCPCGDPGLSDEQRQSYMDWLSAELGHIRDGSYEVCAGETGSEFPAVDWAEQSVTEFNVAIIVADAISRGEL